MACYSSGVLRCLICAQFFRCEAPCSLQSKSSSHTNCSSASMWRQMPRSRSALMSAVATGIARTDITTTCRRRVCLNLWARRYLPRKTGGWLIDQSSSGRFRLTEDLTAIGQRLSSGGRSTAFPSLGRTIPNQVLLSFSARPLLLSFALLPVCHSASACPFVLTTDLSALACA